MRKTTFNPKIFKEKGWAGPFPLLNSGDVQKASKLFYQVKDHFLTPNELKNLGSDDILVKPWFKSMHIFQIFYKEIVTHHSIIDKLTFQIGNDIIAWGCTVTLRKPSQTHRWHVDVEHKKWNGITAFIGLRGTCLKSSIKLISGSHRIKFTPQELQIDSDEAAIQFCRKQVTNAEFHEIDLKEGEFILFHGLLWHASKNSTGFNRLALIAQYTNPKNKILIPLTWDDPIIWHNSKPPCLLVKGKDHFKINQIVS